MGQSAAVTTVFIILLVFIDLCATKPEIKQWSGLDPFEFEHTYPHVPIYGSDEPQHDYEPGNAYEPSHHNTAVNLPKCKPGAYRFYKDEQVIDNSNPACGAKRINAEDGLPPAAEHANTPASDNNTRQAACGTDYNTPTMLAYAKCKDAKMKLQVGGHCEVKCQDVSDYSKVYKSVEQLRFGFATESSDTAQTYCLATRLAGDGLGGLFTSLLASCKLTAVAYCCEPYV